MTAGREWEEYILVHALLPVLEGVQDGVRRAMDVQEGSTSQTSDSQSGSSPAGTPSKGDSRLIIHHSQNTELKQWQVETKTATCLFLKVLKSRKLKGEGRKKKESSTENYQVKDLIRFITGDADLGFKPSGPNNSISVHNASIATAITSLSCILPRSPSCIRREPGFGRHSSKTCRSRAGITALPCYGISRIHECFAQEWCNRRSAGAPKPPRAMLYYCH